MQARSYIIQLELPLSEGRSLEELQAFLAECGVQLDQNYKPVCVNPKLQHYVVRGMASDEERLVAQAIKGVQFFSDPMVGETK